MKLRSLWASIFFVGLQATRFLSEILERGFLMKKYSNLLDEKMIEVEAFQSLLTNNKSKYTETVIFSNFLQHVLKPVIEINNKKQL